MSLTAYLKVKLLRPILVNMYWKTGGNMNSPEAFGSKHFNKKSNLKTLNQTIDKTIYFAGKINDI